MGELSVWHWLLVALVAMMLFGANRLPDVARSVGRSMRIFKAEMRGIEQDGGSQMVDGVATPEAPAAPEGAAPAGVPPEGPEGVTPAGGSRRPGAE
jgi:sec-independent protein translocase protein TatA